MDDTSHKKERGGLDKRWEKIGQDTWLETADFSSLCILSYRYLKD